MKCPLWRKNIFFLEAAIRDCFHSALLQNRYTFINKLLWIDSSLKTYISLNFLHRLYNETTESNTLWKFFEFIHLVRPQRDDSLRCGERGKLKARSYTHGKTASKNCNDSPADNKTIYLNDVLNFLDKTFASSNFPEYRRDTRVRMNKIEMFQGDFFVNCIKNSNPNVINTI